MELERLMPHLEALVFASDRPLTQLELTEYLATALEEPVTGEQVSVCLDAVREKYDSDFYPFCLREIGGGFQFLTKKAYHKTVLQLNGDKHLKKLSAAALETLAIIAYKGPITKSDIEFIRGVSADYSIQKLLEKELIIIAGRKEEAVGKPLIYATSRQFMDYLGINSAADLPQLKDFAALDVVLPTDAADAQPEEGGATPLSVAEDGSLQEG